MLVSFARLLGLVALALAAAGVFVVPPAQAQDIEIPQTRRVETVTGPYTVVADAYSLPSLQSVQFFIKVTETETGQPVDDLVVTIFTSWSGSNETGENIALGANVVGLYTATLKLDPGSWETNILVEPPEGGAYGADGFAFEIPRPSNNLEAGFVFLGVTVVLLAGAGYLVWRIRKNQRERAERTGTPTA